MPSKELIEKVAIVLNEQEGCYFQPQDYHRGAAKEVISTIRADLLEDRYLHEIIERHFNMPHGIGYGKDRLYAFLAASALGEQSE